MIVLPGPTLAEGILPVIAEAVLEVLAPPPANRCRGCGQTEPAVIVVGGSCNPCFAVEMSGRVHDEIRRRFG